MKKNAYTVLILTICSFVLFASSCRTDKPEVPVQPKSDVTVMIYGSGGGSLDRSMIGKFRQLFHADADAYKHVQVAVQFKFSEDEKMPGWRSEEERNTFYETLEREGEAYMDSTITEKKYLAWMQPDGYSTMRFVVDPGQILYTQAKDSYLEDDNCDITHPDSLAAFIRWAARQCPARKYVLVLADHGRAYQPHEEVGPDETCIKRAPAALIDDMGHDKRHFTLNTLHQGIRNAGVRLDAIYFDCCLMNCLEYQFGLKDLCDYIVASTYVMQGGAKYDDLMECLAQSPDDMASALSTYIHIAMDKLSEEMASGDKPLYLDLTVTRTDRLDALGRKMRQFVDKLCDAYANGSVDGLDAVDAVTDKAVKISSMSPFYDAAKYMKAIMLALPDVYDEAFYIELKKSFNDCLVAQAYSRYLTERNYKVDYSVLLGAFGHYRWGRWNTNPVSIPYVWSYEVDGTLYEYQVVDGEFGSEEDYYCQFLLLNKSKWAGTLESTYGQTAFDQAVGWSRWLMLNHHEPSMWSKSGFEEELDDDDL